MAINIHRMVMLSSLALAMPVNQSTFGRAFGMSYQVGAVLFAILLVSSATASGRRNFPSVPASKFSSRIIGGNVAAQGAAPYQVSIQNSLRYIKRRSES